MERKLYGSQMMEVKVIYGASLESSVSNLSSLSDSILQLLNGVSSPKRRSAKTEKTKK